jgi:alpha-methylacyl-CoA racemase
MLCAMGILLALIERNSSGKGQVVDAAMVDGAANLSVLFHGLLANHLMTLDIGSNVLDSGAHYYQTYETADGKFMAVGAIEGRFYSELIKGLGMDAASLPHQNDMQRWPEMTERFAEVFKTKTRDEWTGIFEGKDACVAPVLDLNEVDQHPHNRERRVIIDIDGVPQPAPAPRLSRTPGKVSRAGRLRGSDMREILTGLGYTEEDVKELIETEIVEKV